MDGGCSWNKPIPYRTKNRQDLFSYTNKTRSITNKSSLWNALNTSATLKFAWAILQTERPLSRLKTRDCGSVHQKLEELF